ncbi:MAG: S58 family peptidase [Bacteroidetes bacterium]|nr:MAG: S58 family peptidase [Bacteroidota bacterium]
MTFGSVFSGLWAAFGLRNSDARSSGNPSSGARARLRDLGIRIGRLPTGPHNAITDVRGVRVGHKTNISGSGKLVVGTGPVRTGVTVILPSSGNVYKEKLPVGAFILNGNGELTGLVNLLNGGLLETPIFLTGTANVGIVYDAALTHLLRENPEIGVTGRVPVPVVGECWDSLGDIQGRHLSEDDVLGAIAGATDGPVEEGAVGGGTGMRSYGFKSGIGTSSRMIPANRGGYTVGVLVNANHGSRHLLRVDGVRVGEELLRYPEDEPEKSKSIIIVAATDAPLLPIQLNRLCKRLALGLAKTGSVSTHGSGDLFLAFSTVPRDEKSDVLWTGENVVSSLWEAASEATEEAILNALTASPTMDGADGSIRYGLPLDRLTEIMKKHNRL